MSMSKWCAHSGTFELKQEDEQAVNMAKKLKNDGRRFSDQHQSLELWRVEETARDSKLFDPAYVFTNYPKQSTLRSLKVPCSCYWQYLRNGAQVQGIHMPYR